MLNLLLRTTKRFDVCKLSNVLPTTITNNRCYVTKEESDRFLDSFRTKTNNKKSYASTIIPDVYLLPETIWERIELNANTRGNEICYIFPHNGNLKITFSELRQRVETIAQNLLNLGIQKGDRVAFILPNTVELVITKLACASIGVISVILNIGYQLFEIEYMLKKTGAKGLVIYDSFKTLKHLDIMNQICPELENSKPGELNSAKLPNLKHIFVLNSPFSTTKQNYKGTWSYDKLSTVQSSAAKIQFPYVDIDDPCFILFTSGTTGFPKGAVIRHGGVISTVNIFNNVPIGKIGWGTRCIPIPIFHVFGLATGTISPLIGAEKSVFSFYLPESMTILKAIQSYKCDSLLGPPTILIDLLNHPERSKHDLSSLKNILLGSTTVPPDLINKAKKEFNVKNMIIGYGMTETSLGHCMTTYRDFDVSEKKAYESIGRPFPFTETKIVDPKTNQIVDLNTDGELCIRGFNVINEYWDDKEKTAQSIDEKKWLRTGDICQMDADGYIYYKTRSKDLIIRGGVNIYPAEIEAFLRTHPNIIDANAVGVPDKRFGEEVCVWVRLKANTNLTYDELKKFCDGNIAYFKVPKYMKVVDSFPLNPNGKVLKHKIIEQAKIDLNLN